MKKVCFNAKTDDGDKTYKFGVFNTKNWLKSIDDAIANYEN